MTHTPTRPVTDKAMWRQLLALAHPDAAKGTHELFIWTSNLREYVAGDSIEAPNHVPPRRTTTATSDRVPFEPDVGFEDLTMAAVRAAREVPERYGWLLRLLLDCEESYHGPLAREQRRGTSYKRLAAVRHVVGMNKAERVGWYRVCESVSLSDRHAGFLLDRLKRRVA